MIFTKLVVYMLLCPGDCLTSQLFGLHMKVKFTVEQAMKAQRAVALTSVVDWWGGGGSTLRRGRVASGEIGPVPRASLDGCEKSRFHGASICGLFIP